MGCFVSTLFFIILTAVVALKLYIKLTTGWCRSYTCLVGKTAIITGANTGIGYDTALDFAKRGARVILACRNRDNAEEARRKIIKHTGNENVVVKLIDLASFASVRAFAEDINKTEGRLDILVNNAGILVEHHTRSEDGHDLLMQTNHFSSFLLTKLLLKLLTKSAPSRIVNVSSKGAEWAHFELSKIDSEDFKYNSYTVSKLCNILFTMELAKRLKGTGVTTYSLHPGVIATDIFRNIEGFRKILLDYVLRIFQKTSEEGAQTTIFCSVSKNIEELTGAHFADCHRVEIYKSADVPELPALLWELSEKIIQ